MTVPDAPVRRLRLDAAELPVHVFDTVVIGAGASGLRCAVGLARHFRAQPDRTVAIVAEDLYNSTSYNAGSDKQTVYTWGVARETPDAPRLMAEQLFEGGSMDGDLALVQANLSARAFYGLAEFGVPFPHDAYGGYGGYVTDHSPAKRGASIGPLTSKRMVEVLLDEAAMLRIPTFDGVQLVSLLVDDGRVVGLIGLDKNRLDEETYGLVVFHAQNVVFAVGGPGGLYKRSVYPACHHGAIGIALEAGARAVNLTESQHGLASIGFRWNVSGTYQQVVPRYVSTDRDGGDEREFLRPYFPTTGRLATAIFLKGYQWPFDPRKIPDHGSSLIDVLVYIETEVKGRRVFMDFRRNPSDYRFEELGEEARRYLDEAGAAALETPYERLAHMNPQAIALYRDHGIDLATEPLEIAVCNQHNNGGLETDAFSESVSLRRLFPLGEVAGQHGVYRPGGSALNAGQTFAIQAAERIAFDYRGDAVPYDRFERTAGATVARLLGMIERLLRNEGTSVADYRAALQERMTRYAAHIRTQEAADALEAAYAQIDAFDAMAVDGIEELPEAFLNRQYVIAHAAYLDAIATYIAEDGGSRGSYLVLDPSGVPVLPELGETWRYKPDNPAWRERVLVTERGPDGRFRSFTRPRRPLPEVPFQFEAAMNRHIARVRGEESPDV